MQFDKLERGLTEPPDGGNHNGIADQLARLKAAYQKLSS
jgi:hypothetical protein